MKGDMSGGAAVVAAMCAIADLELPVRAIAVVASTENMPGGHAYRPGDILTAANGKTIEVTNTDAEGRLVLADALWYAREQGATHVMDLATLTGAMVVALGDLYAGFFANDDEWADAILAAGEASGDHIWRMPLHPRYRRYVKSSYADMKNSSDLREAGAGARRRVPQGVRGRGAVGAPRHRRPRVPRPLARRLPVAAGRQRLRRAAHRRARVAARGLNLDLTEEQQLVRDTVRTFARERVAPVAAELDR